jgi:hypothetical protein
MRSASLLCVLLLARVCSLVGRDVPVSAWSPVAYLWQDLLLVVLFAGIDLPARKRPWVGWTLYVVIVLYTVINVPVIRVLGTPLTRPMLRAAGAPLADSIAHYATFTNLALPVLVLAAAAALPRLFRHARPRHVLIGIIASVPVIAFGPLATARVETQGGHRNAVFALVSGLVPRVEATGEGDPVPDPVTPSLVADDLARFRGAAANRNVVVVLLESAAAQYLRPYGAVEDPMPNLTALAGEGMLFEHAYAVYPESIKGLFTILCSRYPGRESEVNLLKIQSNPVEVPRQLFTAERILDIQQDIASECFVGDVPRGYRRYFDQLDSGLQRAFHNARAGQCAVAIGELIDRDLAYAKDCGERSGPGYVTEAAPRARKKLRKAYAMILRTCARKDPRTIRYEGPKKERFEKATEEALAPTRTLSPEEHAAIYEWEFPKVEIDGA